MKPLTPQELARIASDYGMQDKPKSTYKPLKVARGSDRRWPVSEHSTLDRIGTGV